jgi:hypothetical protein
MKTLLMPLLAITGCASISLRPYELDAVKYAAQEAGQAADFAGVADTSTYPAVVRSALQGNSEDLSRVFKVSTVADAAGADLQSDILRALLLTLGDTNFSTHLSREPLLVQKNNFNLLAYSMGSEFRHYSSTARLIDRTAR